MRNTKVPNNRVNSDSQKRRGFRYATATPLLSAGYAQRYVLSEISNFGQDRYLNSP